MTTTCLANAEIVLDDRVLRGSVEFEDGRITGIQEGGKTPAGAIDCGGDYLIPGLIELHTDNLERHIQPRPKVEWPHGAAILAHDGEFASVGVTTVFDAMRVGVVPRHARDSEDFYARKLSRELWSLRDAKALRISHFLHLRAEICSKSLATEIAEFGPNDRVGIVSLMDHTPGQRQFRDMEKLKIFGNSQAPPTFECYCQFYGESNLPFCACFFSFLSEFCGAGLISLNQWWDGSGCRP